MRLAFRELGLSIGLKAAIKLQQLVMRKPRLSRNKELCSAVKSLAYYKWLSDEIDWFWLKPASREGRNWKEHEDINMVMLATSLAPDGFLGA